MNRSRSVSQTESSSSRGRTLGGSPRRICLFAACALSWGACTGGIDAAGRDQDGGGTPGRGGRGGSAGQGGDPGALKLDRNPGRPLVCDAPGRAHLGTTPFVPLTSREYLRTVADLLAPLSVDLSGRISDSHLRAGFAPEEALAATRDDVGSQHGGAQAIGARVGAGLAQLGIDGCPPGSAGAERACLDAFLDDFGRRAYRRPLDQDERARAVALFESQRRDADFATALSVLVEGLVQSPQFLYRLELGGPDEGGRSKLSGYEVAARLSYLLWGSMPDRELFAAAERGELDDADGVSAQVRRMLDDPRARNLAHDYTDLWLHLDLRRPRAGVSQKSSEKFPRYTAETVTALNAGFDRFVEDALLGDEGGLRKLLGSRTAWVNASSAWIYDVEATGGDLQPVALDPRRRQGLLTQALLLATGANREKQAPIQRAVVVLEHLLCAPPPPPPDAALTMQPPPAPVPRTTRQRLEEEHETQSASCKSCHSVIDAFGFAFEHYDAVGRWQDEEDGMPIDASARVEGTYDADGDFRDAIGLIDKLRDSEQVAQCHVEHFLRFSLGRDLAEDDGCAVAQLTNTVVDSPSDLRALVEDLTRSELFRYRSSFVR